MNSWILYSINKWDLQHLVARGATAFMQATVYSRLTVCFCFVFFFFLTMGASAKSSIGAQPAMLGNIASTESESKKMNNCCFYNSVSLICSFLLKQQTATVANMI